MNKKQLLYIRIPALILSCLIAFLSIGNFLTVVTHSIKVDTPEGNDIIWAIDPVNEELLFLTDFSISNQGAYDIDDIDITARLETENGKEIINLKKNDLVVKRGSNKIFEIKVNTSFKELDLIDWLEILYKHSIFKVHIKINACYMFSLIDFNVDETIEYKWWAPLGNITKDDYIIKKLFDVVKKLDTKKGQGIIDLNDFSFIENLWNFDLKTDWGYDFFVNIYDDIENNFKTISFKINAPIKKLEGSISVEFKILIYQNYDSFNIKIKEVNIGYVAD